MALSGVFAALTYYASSTESEFSFLPAFGWAAAVTVSTIVVFMIFDVIDYKPLVTASMLVPYSAFIIFNVQRIVNRHGLNKDDTILGVACLYLDIFLLALYAALGAKRMHKL